MIRGRRGVRGILAEWRTAPRVVSSHLRLPEPQDFEGVSLYVRPGGGLRVEPRAYLVASAWVLRSLGRRNRTLCSEYTALVAI